MFQFSSLLMGSKSLRANKFKTIFPAFDQGAKLRSGLPLVIHPTAMYQASPNEELIILLMNGLQPKSSTDFFVLWHLRTISETLIQSGKSLREEHDAMSYTDRVKYQAGLSLEEYTQNFT